MNDAIYELLLRHVFILQYWLGIRLEKYGGINKTIDYIAIVFRMYNNKEIDLQLFSLKLYTRLFYHTSYSKNIWFKNTWMICWIGDHLLNIYFDNSWWCQDLVCRLHCNFLWACIPTIFSRCDQMECKWEMLPLILFQCPLKLLSKWFLDFVCTLLISNSVCYVRIKNIFTLNKCTVKFSIYIFI